MICLQDASIKDQNFVHSPSVDEGGREGFGVPYFLGGCPTPAAPPMARPRLETPAAADPAATAVWRGLAASSSAASRRLLCKQDLTT